MSKTNEEDRSAPAETEVRNGEPTLEAKRGKKRKRKGNGQAHAVTDGAELKKGAGKLMKFGDEPANPINTCEEQSDTFVSKPIEKPKETLREAVKEPKRDKSKPEETPKLEEKSKPGQRSKEQGRRKSEIRGPPVRNYVPPHLLKKRDELLKTRQSLPIWSHADSIREALRKNNILVLTGETGSGKSTQVPQFLLSEPWCTKTIAITQPRRVAAISLARRVADEMGTFFGNQSPAAKVGYSVRFDNATGPNTKVKFLTEGMLLQEVLRDPEMNQYSAVVVDEVHERSVNVDLILGFLRNLVSGIERGESKRKQPLKVVIMSATADVEGLVKFFAEGFAADSSKPASPETGTLISKCFVEGRQYPVKTHYLPEPSMDWVESALKIIFQIHYKEPLPGDILVFLTGQDKIEGLEKLVNDYAEGMDKEMPKLLALPLFAALPQQAQQRIFQPTPRHTRKVILATNIAETSVTVPGVRFVIDCGKSKIKQFRSKLGLESLLAKSVSKSAAIQRKGRAGREAPGQCYRLYTEADYKTLEERTVPEILRCDLVQAILTMKARGVNDVLNFPFLDKPPLEALKEALFQLLRLSALKADGTISDMGLQMARLPITPKLGRILLEAARPERDCLLDAIDIISALSTEDNIFFNIVTEEKKEAAEEARRELYRREGDHLTYLATVQQYAEEETDRRAWCDKHFVSHRAMQNVMNIRKQLRQQCQSLKLLSPDTLNAPSSSPNTDAILASLLRGFVSNTARLAPDGSYKTFIGNHTVSIHPSSVLHGRKVKAEAIVFSEFLYTNKAYAKKVSAVQMNWVEEVMKDAFGI
ncbi:P-loop containing nucleoside triphosphate hydrolase protein, partial [Periconia macrospinosa]